MDGACLKAIAEMQPEQAHSVLTQASAWQCNAYAVVLCNALQVMTGTGREYGKGHF